METKLPLDQSQFNQAQFEQIRLHEVKRIVNEVSINLLAWNEIYQSYNYEVMFNTLNVYLGEVTSKFTPGENEALDKLRNELETVLFGYDIFVQPKQSPMMSKPSPVKINKRVWKIVKEGLFQYQKLILKTSHVHGLGNPTKSNPALAALH